MVSLSEPEAGVLIDDGFDEWISTLAQERQARMEAEALAARHASEVARLREENHLLRGRVESLPIRLSQAVWEQVEPLKAELERLRAERYEINLPYGLTCGRWPIREDSEEKEGRPEGHSGISLRLPL